MDILSQIRCPGDWEGSAGKAQPGIHIEDLNLTELHRSCWPQVWLSRMCSGDSESILLGITWSLAWWLHQHLHSPQRASWVYTEGFLGLGATKGIPGPAPPLPQLYSLKGSSDLSKPKDLQFPPTADKVPTGTFLCSLAKYPSYVLLYFL